MTSSHTPQPDTGSSEPGDPYAGLSNYVGDIHNHCGISYGHGSLTDAYRNARLQLDFASVTGHAWWHDMPSGDPRLLEEEAYHREGFERLAGQWDQVQQITESVHEDGEFVSLLSFEWHSMTYGDHCVYYKGASGPIIRADSLEELREELRTLAAEGIDALALPHHIGYQKGWRGINWDTYTTEFSPVAEIVSMHGCGESDRAPRNYLHTMGPRDAESMAYYGLNQGHVFGFIGSTDHHSAHPGSHGYGRMAVWANELTREGIWEAIVNRRTYAITGDRISLKSAVNGHPMGQIAPAAAVRTITAEVVAGAAVDLIEVVRNGDVIYSGTGNPPATGEEFTGLVGLSLGWGKAGVTTDWDVLIEVRDGSLLGIEPRLHGIDIVDPLSPPPETFSFSSVDTDGDTVRLQTQSQPNPTVMTDTTQAISLHVSGNNDTLIRATINGQIIDYTLAELRGGPHTGYTSGFVSAAYQFHRAIGDSERTIAIQVEDIRDGSQRDWYHVRVRQTNDQWAFGTPTWVEEA